MSERFLDDADWAPSAEQSSEEDEATAWHIDNMYDIGLIIGGGSSNIQRNIIGERGLGLPREPKARVPATGRA